jgi:uncharacterized protein (DUF2062 family)
MVAHVLLLEHVDVHHNGQVLIVEFLYVIQPLLIVRMVGFVLLQIHAYVHLYGLVLIALSLFVIKDISNQMVIKHHNINNVI